MSLFDTINFFSLKDVDRGSKNQEHLGDLRERAHDIGKKNGIEPMSWSEFQQKSPREEPRNVINMLLGSAIGMAAGLVIGMAIPELLFPMALSAAVIGGAAGAFSDTENTRRTAMVGKYEEYLDAFEDRLSKSRAPSQGIDYKTTYGAEILAGRQTNESQISR